MREKIESIKGFKLNKTYTHKSLFGGCKSTVALVDVSLSVSPGEIVGIIGKNGAGKTTLIKILSGIIFPDSGSVEIMGSNPFERQREYRQSVAIIMGQKSQMDEDVSIYDNAMFMASIYRVRKEVANDRISSLALQLGITNQLRQQVRTLSLGQRMKGDLLIAFLHNPMIVFLDEPTLGLDYSTQRSVRSFLREYVKKNNASLILTSHNIDDIKELSDKIMILNEGKSLYVGSIEELYRIVKPQKFLELKKLNGTKKLVEIKNNNEFIKVMERMMDDGYKEINVIDIDLNEVIEELYKRSRSWL